MVRQITDGSEHVFHAHVHGRLRVIRALDQVEQVEPHPDSLESQAVIDGSHPVTVLVQQLEPGHHPRVVPPAHDEAAAEDEQDGGPVERVARDGNRLVYVHEQVAGVTMGDQVSSLLLCERQGAQQRGQKGQDGSFHCSDSISSTSLSTASLSGMCRRTGSLPR